MIGEYELNKVMCLDSYKAIKSIPDKSVDCVYTDIPYLYRGGYNKHDNKCGVGISQELVENINTIIDGINYDIFKDFIRISKKINCFIWCSKDQIFDIISFFIKHNCYFDILVWCKNNPQPLANNMWLTDIEYCLYFREKGVLLNDGYDIKSKWFISSINQHDKALFNHPTIKPLDLVKRHLLHTTQPNDIVADFFTGSGTTAVACQETGRNFIGSEISEKWCKIANDRLNKIDANGQMSLFYR